jgi:hypothetical protein
VPSPKISTFTSPSGDIERTSNSTATSFGRSALSHNGLFLTPGDRSCPFSTRHNPPLLQNFSVTTSGFAKSSFTGSCATAGLCERKTK